MNNNNFKHISVILQDVLKNSGINKRLKNQIIKDEWENIIGEKLSKICSVYKIKNDHIILKIEKPSWRTELFLQREIIIKKINEKIGENLIKDIRFI